MTGWVLRPGLFHVGATASVRALALQAEAAGSQVSALPPVASKDALLAALRRELRFPEWAGHNWDAAAELLADLSWLPPGPITLIWAEPEALSEADPTAYRMAVEVLAYATRVIRARTLTVVLAHRGPH